MKEEDFTTVFRYVREVEIEDYWSFLEWLVLARIQRCESNICSLEIQQAAGDKEENLDELLVDCRAELAAFQDLKAFVDQNKNGKGPNRGND
ncbi:MULTISPECIES: hypothetical protein [Paenibacillus]|jgi:hypothetical protein|uniref:hypothetical protein n=1 Tax=Paenibacillus TaxID=44249 RepID=UPI00096EE1B5|nr:MULTISPECIES: hypothetical protein [Paenibacillus]MXO77150.1 hypothetical protein [Paenibacillus sp. OT2-17]OMF23218.1 hypothetical protein BK134_26920 [Paenibacillus peoriae]